MPWSEIVTTGKLATIRDSAGKTVKLYIDVTIGAMTGDDGAAVFRDWRTGIEVSTFETVIPRLSNGTVNVTKPITCKAFASYKLSSNGIAKLTSGGDPANSGHRGIPPSAMALHPSDTGIIAHRMKVSLGPPADHPGPNYPMYGIESPRGGGIPEGAVIRRKVRDTSNQVRLAAHDYGLIIGDTAGGGKSALKTVQGGVYPTSVLQALDGTTWADWEVMTLGFK